MITILQGDCLEQLATIESESVQCCVTSPPYWGLRDYGVAGQIGLEKTPDEYVAKMVSVFREVRRVLKGDGVLWLNLGDSYASGSDGKPRPGSDRADDVVRLVGHRNRNGTPVPLGLKHKDLVGIPWRVAFALQSDGWYLRSDIIWHKPNPMPESVTDRPTKAHEYIFLMSKAASYYYDGDAIAEPVSESLIKQVIEGYSGHATKDFFGAKAQNASGTKSRIIDGYRKKLDKEGVNSRIHVSRDPNHESEYNGKHRGGDDQSAGRRMLKNALEARQAGGAHDSPFGLTRNKRTVWTVATISYRESHFATFPPDLIKPCILAGSRTGDTVLDPFGGSGTTGQVALELGRKAILIEINPAYIEMIKTRTSVTPGLPL